MNTAIQKLAELPRYKKIIEEAISRAEPIWEEDGKHYNFDTDKLESELKEMLTDNMLSDLLLKAENEIEGVLRDAQDDEDAKMALFFDFNQNLSA